MSDPRTRAGALVVTAVFSVQLGAALAVELFDDLGPTGAVLLRTLFAAAVLVAVWRPRPAAWSRGEWRQILLFGAILAGMNLSFYAALERLPLGIAVTIEFIGPLGVAIALSRRARDFAWVALATLGILLLAPDIGGDINALGAVFALVAAACWAAYIFASAAVGRGSAGNAGLAGALSVAALLLLAPGIAGGGSALLDPHLLAIGAAVAIASSAIPYAAEFEALKRISAGTFGVLLSLEPAVAALVGFVALGQGLDPREAVAIALVVAASAGALGSSPGPQPREGARALN